MRIVNFQKYEKPANIPDKLATNEVASFEIEIQAKEGGVLVWRGWSIRQRNGKYYFQGPLLKCFSRTLSGPAILFNMPTPHDFIKKLMELVKVYGYEITQLDLKRDRREKDRPKTAEDVIRQTKKALMEIRAMNMRATEIKTGNVIR